MSQDKYIVTGTDPMMPLGLQEAEEIALALTRFLEGHGPRVCAFTQPLEIYRFAAGHMMKVAGKGGMPFLAGDDMLFVPISESTPEYSYTGFELWQKIEGQWERSEQKVATAI